MKHIHTFKRLFVAKEAAQKRQMVTTNKGSRSREAQTVASFASPRLSSHADGCPTAAGESFAPCGGCWRWFFFRPPAHLAGLTREQRSETTREERLLPARSPTHDLACVLMCDLSEQASSERVRCRSCRGRATFRALFYA